MGDNKTSADANRAVERFGGGYRCAESILTVYGEKAGCDPALCMKIGCAFGGGMGGKGEVCGVVSAAVAVLGMKYGRTDNGDAESRAKTDAKVREFIDRFRAAHRHLRCNDLVGFDRSTEEGHDKAAATGVFKRLCPELVRDAALILEDLLKD